MLFKSRFPYPLFRLFQSNIGTANAQMKELIKGKNLMPIGLPIVFKLITPIKLDSAIPRINPPIIPTIIENIILIVNTPF